jgi:hypothetical protein
VIIDDVINGCDVLLQEKQNIPNRKKKFHKLKDNCHDETMLTLLLAKAFHSDKLNSYANLTALFTKVIYLIEWIFMAFLLHYLQTSIVSMLSTKRHLYEVITNMFRHIGKKAKSPSTFTQTEYKR